MIWFVQGSICLIALPDLSYLLSFFLLTDYLSVEKFSLDSDRVVSVRKLGLK